MDDFVRGGIVRPQELNFSLLRIWSRFSLYGFKKISEVQHTFITCERVFPFQLYQFPVNCIVNFRITSAFTGIHNAKGPIRHKIPLYEQIK